MLYTNKVYFIQLAPDKQNNFIKKYIKPSSRVVIYIVNEALKLIYVKQAAEKVITRNICRLVFKIEAFICAVAQ